MERPISLLYEDIKTVEKFSDRFRVTLSTGCFYTKGVNLLTGTRKTGLLHGTRIKEGWQRGNASGLKPDDVGKTARVRIPLPPPTQILFRTKEPSYWPSARHSLVSVCTNLSILLAQVRAVCE